MAGSGLKSLSTIPAEASGIGALAGNRERVSARPICIDLYCGLGGWAEGFLAEGWQVIGFDIEARPYPGQLVLQDALTLHGAQFRNAACIVASPPCTEYSYMAQPWSRGKQIARALRGQGEFPEGYTGSQTIEQLNALFDACFRIQREASESAGRYIPMVVENVKGAQPWVGKARANFGSFYLWGDVDSIGSRIVKRGETRWGAPAVKAGRNPMKSIGLQNANGELYRQGINKMRDAFKACGSPGQQNVGQNPDGRKLPGDNTPRMWSDREIQRLHDAPSGTKMVDKGTKNGKDWFGSGENCSEQRRHGSKSDSRKAASAQIAKIPAPLAKHIARIFKP